MTELNIQNNLPLTEATFYILVTLAPGPQHGYAIMKEVEVLSDGRIKLSTGTLYGAIKRLLTQNWLERVEEENKLENGRLRKAYQLTDLGRKILDAETTRLQSLLDTAQKLTSGAQA